MGSVAEWFRGVVKGTKIFVQKVGAFIMLIFVLGLIAGAYIVAAQLSILWFFAFGLVVVVLWNDFGEGIGVLLLLLVLFLFFPQIFPPIII
ncbi:MAG: hypothetical protein AABX02_04605 [archaeon]